MESLYPKWAWPVMSDLSEVVGKKPAESEGTRAGADHREEPNLFRLLYLVSVIGFGVVCTIFISFLAGLWMMREFGGGYVPVVGALVTGTGVSFLWVYRKCCRLMNIALKRDEGRADIK